MTDKAERKSLETILDDQHAALLAVIPPEFTASYVPPDRVPIKWENKDWDDVHQLYLRATYEAGDPRYPELGRNTRKDVPGEFLIGIFTPAGSGLDLPDNLASVLALAYPYGLEIDTAQGKVEVRGFAKRRGAPTPDGRYYTPVHINFMLWRSR